MLQWMWADIAVAHLLSFPSVAVFNIDDCGYKLSDYPRLQALKEKFEAIPQIAAWIKERPVTPI